MSLNGVSIVTTTWNERENIEKLVSAIRRAFQSLPYEIIVVDDNSPDGTIHIAKRLADVAVTKAREGQTKGLLCGMQPAKYHTIITIDADLENDYKHIPNLVQQTAKFDIVVASRTKLPRISEKIASKTLGKMLSVTNAFSNLIKDVDRLEDSLIGKNTKVTKNNRNKTIRLHIGDYSEVEV